MRQDDCAFLLVIKCRMLEASAWWNAWRRWSDNGRGAQKWKDRDVDLHVYSICQRKTINSLSSPQRHKYSTLTYAVSNINITRFDSRHTCISSWRECFSLRKLTSATCRPTLCSLSDLSPIKTCLFLSISARLSQVTYFFWPNLVHVILIYYRFILME